MLYSTLRGVVIGGLRIDECQASEEDPASCVARDAWQNWEVGRRLHKLREWRIDLIVWNSEMDRVRRGSDHCEALKKAPAKTAMVCSKPNEWAARKAESLSGKWE